MHHFLFIKLWNQTVIFLKPSMECYETQWMFLLPGFGQQAQKHLALAKEMLPLWFSCREEKLEVLTCLLSIHLTQGAACVVAAKYPDVLQSFTFYTQRWKEIPKSNAKWGLDLFLNLADEAEASFLEAGKTLEELHQQSSISLEEKTNTELEISTGLYRYKHLLFILSTV